MTRVTMTKSDISGQLVEDKDVAQIVVKYPGDRRRGNRVIDASVAEVDRILGEYGKTVGIRGRKPEGEEDGTQRQLQEASK